MFAVEHRLRAKLLGSLHLPIREGLMLQGIRGGPWSKIRLRLNFGSARCEFSNHDFRLAHGLGASLLFALWPVIVTFLISTTDPALFTNLTVAVPVSSLPDADTVVRACTCRTCPFGNSVL
jgi:hypothetical protein